MIDIFKQHMKTKILFLSTLISVSLYGMKNNGLVHEALLNAESVVVVDESISPEHASLADCLRDNHHVQIYENNSKQCVLAFTMYGEDALQWIVPKDDNEIDKKWIDLRHALEQVINYWHITKIIFRIQPETIRLKEIREYSCLLHVDYISIVNSIIIKLNLSNITIEYLPQETLGSSKNSFFLYRKKSQVISSNNVIINKDITVETLRGWDPLDNNTLRTQASKSSESVISPKEFSTTPLILYGGGATIILFFGWYWYNKSKAASLKRLP
jgi:hypothetical protein